MTNSSEITFVCCVEFGWLEQQTLRMIESLRRYGGRFRNSPVIAVTPRFGPKLNRQTIEKLDELKVLYLVGSTGSPFSWMGFYNKPLALQRAAPFIKTAISCFVDSDLLFVGEPDALTFADEEDFLAFPVEIKEMGTTGPGDSFESLWVAAAECAGVELEKLPWVQTALTDERIRLYFNSGLMAYRTSSGFSEEYLRLCTNLLASGITSAHRDFSHGFKEMVSAGFAVMTLNLRWRALPFSHNYSMLSGGERLDFRMADLIQACIVHHHDSMWPNHWQLFLERIQRAHPDVGAWLQSLGPLSVTGPLAARVLSRVLKEHRGRRGRIYASNCRVV